MVNSSLTMLRRELKYRLRAKRVEITMQGILPVCPICNKPITKWMGVEMHEVVTRKEAMKTDANIHTDKNSVLLHASMMKCHDFAQHYDWAEFLCIDHLIRWEGLDAIYEYYKSLLETTHTIGVKQMSITKDIKDIVDKLKKEFGIEADGTLKNAIELANQFQLIKSKGQPGANKEYWEILFKSKRKPIVTNNPTKEILSEVFDFLMKTEPIEEKQEDIDGNRDSASEISSEI